MKSLHTTLTDIEREIQNGNKDLALAHLREHLDSEDTLHYDITKLAEELHQFKTALEHLRENLTRHMATSMHDSVHLREIADAKENLKRIKPLIDKLSQDERFIE